VSRRHITRLDNPDNARIERGQWISTFELGSTVVLITARSLNAAPLVAAGQHVAYGRPLLSTEPAT
jgi:hypothetical protein